MIGSTADRSPDRRVLKVSDVNNYIKAVLSHDENLSGISVSGEISNFKVYSSGHAYFSLKDPGGVLKCVMFSSYARRLDFRPVDGTRVVATGSIGVYERDGVYQLYVEDMRPEGIGSLYEQFEKLKKKLSEEGLFDQAHKREVPFLPKAVAVVTSPSGAVIQDIRNVTRRRFPSMPLILYPAAVQGAAAPGELIAGLRQAIYEGLADVIIIGRGGGSIEDLWGFNDEKLAREIYASPIPVISAVGHETDFTICDFVADLRAPTPSAAAELAVPELNDLLYTLDKLSRKLSFAAMSSVRLNTARLDRLKASVSPKGLAKVIEHRQELLDSRAGRLKQAVNARLSRDNARLDGLSRALKAYGPEEVLSRGYGIVTDVDGKVISSVASLERLDRAELRLADGKTLIRPYKNGGSLPENDGLN